MKTQSRFGITVPEQIPGCCCTAQITRRTLDTDSDASLIQFAGCNDFTIEWQAWDFGEEEWVVVQTGGETYNWGDDGELLRVVLTKDGCCTQITNVYWTNE